MMAMPLSTDTRAGCLVEIHNEVLGVHKQVYGPLSRGQVIENLLWACRRSMGAEARGEPFDVCVHIFSDRIVMRFHCPAWKDLESARAAMQTFVDEGRAGI